MFTKPPSAELRPDQKDTDSLPEYELLDRILKAYIEQYRPAREIADEVRVPIELVRDIINKVDRNEYKRQQAAPGLKVTTKAFGIGRRFPDCAEVHRMRLLVLCRRARIGGVSHQPACAWSECSPGRTPRADTCS